jgi:histidine triad (HIT) family protein
MAEELQDKGKCIFCSIVDGSNPSAKIYEDDKIICVLDIFPASKGHLLIIPKKHFAFSTQMDTELSSHVFNFANQVAALIFEAMGAEGTNILVSNGVVAGQKVGHVVVHVIPRYKDDNVNISWESNQISEDELKDSIEKISSKFGAAKGVEEVTPPPIKEIKTKESLEDSLTDKEEKELEDEEDFDEERLP